MSKTVLEIVQSVLNDIDGDEVNSIDDTIEAQQIANIVQSTFENIVSTKDWLHTRTLGQLSGSGTSARPTHMTLPVGCKRVDMISYDIKATGETRNKWREIKYKYPDDFLRYTNVRDNTQTNITAVTDPSGVTLHIRNDIPPTYYTSFDEETLVFDSYDSVIDSTLQASKTQIIHYVIPTLTISDAAEPDLPDEAMVHLIEEVKSRVSLKLRQVQDVKSEQGSVITGRWLSQNDWKVKGGIRYENYGRK